jgi:hypothetical protein
MALSARLPFVLAELPALEGFVDDAADLGVMRRVAVQERSGAVNRIALLKDRLRRRRRYPDRGLRAFAAEAARSVRTVRASWYRLTTQALIASL